MDLGFRVVEEKVRAQNWLGSFFFPVLKLMHIVSNELCLKWHLLLPNKWVEGDVVGSKSIGCLYSLPIIIKRKFMHVVEGLLYFCIFFSCYLCICLWSGLCNWTLTKQYIYIYTYIDPYFSAMTYNSICLLLLLTCRIFLSSKLLH